MVNIKFFKAASLQKWLIVVLITLSLLISACGASKSATDGITGVWVGDIEGTDTFIGIASNGSEVMVYVCDGNTISQWFYGQAGEENLDLAAGTLNLSDANSNVQAQLAVDGASGSVTLANGQSFNFQVPRAAGDAGLYRLEETGNDEQWVSGWVVLNDGQLRGLRVSTKGTVEILGALNSAALRLDPDTKPY
ncbi:MAG: hypothetical protein HYZ21_09710 [Chloroflexi bacterium]|nr:hypothetical protein [Chloroflexota bacterium]